MRPLTIITAKTKSIIITLILLSTILGFLSFYGCKDEFFEVQVTDANIIVVNAPPYYVGDNINLKGEARIIGEADSYIYTFTITKPDGSEIKYESSGSTYSFLADLPGDYVIKLSVYASTGPPANRSDLDDTKITITVEDPDGSIIQLTSPTNNTSVSTFPLPISFTIDEDYLGDYTALIQVDGVLDSSFNNPSQTNYSYDKGCLPSGEHEIKAILRHNENGGYERIDSSTVKITVPPGITCVTEPEEILTVTITSPENNAVLHSLQDEIKVKAWARDGLSYINLTIGNSGSGYQVSGIEDSLTYTLESFNPEPGINMVIARASDINFNDTYDTIYIDYQPPWQVAATYPMSDYPYSSIGFSYNQIGFIGLGRNYPSGGTINTMYKFDPAGNPDIVEVTPYPGAAREAVVHFTIGQYTYVGLGSANAGLATEPVLNEFYRYDMANDTWLQMADFPGQGRIYAVAFAMNGKGYIGLGAYFVNFTYAGLNDFWEFDPANATDPWSQVADFPGGSRYKAHSFAVNDKGYVGGGINTAFTQYRDLYEFDGNTWTQKMDMPFAEALAGVYEGTGTSINNKGYVVGGAGYIANNQQGIWSYNPWENTWQALTFSPFAAFDGEHHFAFVINNVIYCGTSLDPFLYKGNIWSYDPSKEPD